MEFATLKNPPKKYRPHPFWSWNDKLDTEETRTQIRQMCQAGMGGYFMHARGGLQTEYLSKEWFDNILAGCDEGEKTGMTAWGYDENGWPSGFGAGLVNGLGEKYQQKYLRCAVTDAPEATVHTIINIPRGDKNLHFYYEVNPFYVDTLSAEVIAEFIRVTHGAYRENMGEGFATMKGFFTDEPQISRKGFPWSLVLEEAYQSRYGEDLAPVLPALFFDEGDFRRVRYRFWSLVQDLFAESFMEQIYRWCKENGTCLTGHMACEDWYGRQIISNGACMPHYEYMDIPGMDHLGRSLVDLQIIMQVCSVANQLGKKQILAEIFSLCGWNVSFEELRNIYEHQMVHGVNLLCQHLEGYSLRGIRKRDYPASLFQHQPWWGDYRIFNDTVSRIGMLVAEGTVNYEVLVLHTIESGWTSLRDTVTDGSYTGIDDREADAWSSRLLDVMTVLEQNQIPYHLGDPRIMARHGKVAEGKLQVGTQRYSLVIVPPAETLGAAARELLTAFYAEGGQILFVDRIPRYVCGVKDDVFTAMASHAVALSDLEMHIPDTARKAKVTASGGTENFLNLLVRDFEDRTMYYLHNRHTASQTAEVMVRGQSAALFDPVSGEERPVTFTADGDRLTVTCPVEARGSVVLFVYNDDRAKPLTEKKAALTPINEKLAGLWEIASDEDNILTLDYCDVYFDGVCGGMHIPVSDVQEMALSFGRKVKTEVVFHFDIGEKTFSRMRLCVETPEKFEIRVNDALVEKRELGYLHDKAFRLLDIAQYAVEGENTVSLTCDFVQSREVFETAENALCFESERNKLYYDMEIEGVYITGDFGVVSHSPFTTLPNRGLRTAGGFSIVQKNTAVSAGAMASQGYPFFAGTMTFRKTVILTEQEARQPSIRFSRLCSNVTQVRVNGISAGEILWQPYELDLTGLLTGGENTLEITVKGNLRNMLGPFHLQEGESLAVRPGSFFHRSPIWLRGFPGDLQPNWTDTYCFVEFGLFL